MALQDIDNLPYQMLRNIRFSLSSQWEKKFAFIAGVIAPCITRRFPQLLQDVPYLDLSSHIRPRTSSFRREVSDDQLSLCSMDSSMSQSSSMNTEGGHSALGELMETSSHSSSFEEQSTEPTTSTSTSSFAGTILVLWFEVCKILN